LQDKKTSFAQELTALARDNQLHRRVHDFAARIHTVIDTLDDTRNNSCCAYSSKTCESAGPGELPERRRNARPGGVCRIDGAHQTWQAASRSRVRASMRALGWRWNLRWRIFSWPTEHGATHCAHRPGPQRPMGDRSR
jgi:hypothetical protein